MRLILQRVQRGAVSVAGNQLGAIGPGLVILAGVRAGDTAAQADWLAEKTANLRIFEDEAGKMNRSVLESGGSALVISQFTLYANAEKGRRPSFIEAAAPEQAEPLVARFAERLAAQGVPVQTGRFRAEMLVEILNAGPVTIILER
ncbi:MAG: D-tyrosyl-tRNA(Tyr) deacylase [Anaerolineales bacterium]|nr:D-tyrosyl-tRNA(Tyr) deacylase [Anaerolineales bacterium]